jgi:hypothetical protein
VLEGASRIGVGITSMLSVVKTSSKAAVKLYLGHG